MNNNNYNKVMLWVRQSSKFSVELKHWSYPDYFNDNEPHNVWNLYCYIYSDHPLFNLIDKNGNTSQEIFDKIPFHGGCTFFQPHINSITGEVMSYQIGCDFNHHFDRVYTQLNAQEGEEYMLGIADVLFNHLQRMCDDSSLISNQD